jgi:hypothetical protein
MNEDMLDKLKQTLKRIWHGTGLSSPLYVSPKPRIQFDSIADLADALTRAKDAHGDYERGLGQADTNWPLWYAGYMAMEQGLIRGVTCEHGTCYDTVKPQTRVPSVEKVESSTVDVASEYVHDETEYWDAHR